MAKTRGNLSQRMGLDQQAKIEFQRIGGYNHIGRWVFRVTTVPSLAGEPCGQPSFAFAVEFLPRNLRHSRIAAFQPVSLPADLQNSLQEFSDNFFNGNNTHIRSRTLRTPVEIVRCVFAMLNNETLQVNEDSLKEVERVVEWIFQNPESAAGVEGQKVKWYYTHPLLGVFYITEIPV